jgi:hypothetical protein
LLLDLIFAIFFTLNIIASGLIDFLLGTSTTARDLRRKYLGPNRMNLISMVLTSDQIRVQIGAHAQPRWRGARDIQE